MLYTHNTFAYTYLLKQKKPIGIVGIKRKENRTPKKVCTMKGDDGIRELKKDKKYMN